MLQGRVASIVASFRSAGGDVDALILGLMNGGGSMTLVNINVTDLGGKAIPGDRVHIWSPELRFVGEMVVTSALVRVPLTGGVGTVDLTPGEVVVQFVCRGLVDTTPKIIVVPEVGPVDLVSLIGGT